MAKLISTRTVFLKILLLSLILSLIVLSASLLPAAQAATEYARWTRISTPTEGRGGYWVLAAGSDIGYLHLAADSTLYAYVAGLSQTLYQSRDGGSNWSSLGDVSDEIVGIATAPQEDGSLYYATKSRVYLSRDSGRTFEELPAGPGGAGNNNVAITSLAVTRATGNLIAVGTGDTDSTQFGGVYLLDEKEVVPRWEDTAIGSYDVAAVAFSPNYPADHQLVAVVTDETDTWVTSRTGSGGWGATFASARLDKDNSGTPTAISAASPAVIAFPGDYDPVSESGILFVGIDTGSGGGDVYQITLAGTPAGSVATDLNAAGAYNLRNIDISGLSVSGAARNPGLLAGAANSAQTYFSSDGGKSWTRSRKEPTSGSMTRVLLAADFENSHTAYAATSGTGSAFSVSRDSGRTWNQIVTIDK